MFFVSTHEKKPPQKHRHFFCFCVCLYRIMVKASPWKSLTYRRGLSYTTNAMGNIEFLLFFLFFFFDTRKLDTDQHMQIIEKKKKKSKCLTIDCLTSNGAWHHSQVIWPSRKIYVSFKKMNSFFFFSFRLAIRRFFFKLLFVDLVENF